MRTTKKFRVINARTGNILIDLATLAQCKAAIVTFSIDDAVIVACGLAV